MARRELDGYLRRRRRNLESLLHDLECQPFRSEGPEIVLAVDWSEVFSYIIGRGASAGAQQEERQRREATHQVALHVLFDRGPFKEVLLIDPYATEMAFFVERALNNDWSIDVLSADAKTLLSQLSDDETLKEILEMRDRVAKEFGDPSFENFFRYVDQNDALRKTALQCVKKNFRELFLYARITVGNALQGIKHLRTKNNGVRLVGLEDLFPQAAGLGDSPAATAAWLEQLEAMSDSKRNFARRIDAAALEWLYRLNVAMHEANKQLLFVTRDKDIPLVMEKHAGKFACLSDPYWSVMRRGVPRIVRDWHYFFELGITWEPDDREATKRAVLERLDDVEAKLEWVDANAEAYGQIESKLNKELDDDLQNQMALVSAERPWLPEGGPASVEREAVRLFVQLVTDPEKFRAERAEVRERARAELHGIIDALPLQYAPAFVSRAFEEHLPLAKAITLHYDSKLLCSDVHATDAAAYLTKLYDMMRAEQEKPGKARDPAKELPQLQLAPHGSHGLDEYRQVSTALYMLGAFERLEVVRKRLTDDDQFEVLTPGWLFDVLMEVDRRVAGDKPTYADDFIKKRWKEVQGLGEQDSQQALLCLGYLNSWLMLQADLVAPKGENIAEFPKWEGPIGEDTAADQDEVRTELEYVLERVEAQVKLVGLKRVNGRMNRSIRNNVIYVAARLVSVLAELGKAPSQARQLARLSTPTMRGHVAAVERGKTNPEHYDTLAYFYIKRAHAYERGCSEWKRDTTKAGDLLEYALDPNRGKKGDSEKTWKLSARTRNALERHQRLLETIMDAGAADLDGLEEF